ncbi:MAG: hypothetical protein Q7R51_01195 [bacterium]|nr:hypothetical protein [bacterium]
MSERLQPYLKGLSPIEVPFSGSEYLTATKEYGDYYINLTKEGILRASTKQKPFGLPSNKYEPISTMVNTDEPTEELLELNATRSSHILWDGFTHQDIVVHKDEKGPVVFIYTPRLYALLDGSLPYIMTRYDITADKIWIRKQ